MGAAEEILLKLLSGRGLLDARALWATLVGPNRLAMAQAKSLTLHVDRSTELFKSMGAADAYVFIGVSLPAGDPGGAGGIPVLMGRDSELGVNTSIPSLISTIMIGGTFFPVGFTQLVMPGEQLYAKLAPPVAPGTTQQIVVSAVVF